MKNEDTQPKETFNQGEFNHKSQELVRYQGPVRFLGASDKSGASEVSDAGAASDLPSCSVVCCFNYAPAFGPFNPAVNVVAVGEVEDWR